MAISSLKEQFKNIQPGDVGIIGDPVEHSLSPNMHNAAFKTWAGAFRDQEMPTPTYHRFLVKSDQLEEAVHLMKEHRLRGLNVTVPHKINVCQYTDFLSPFAKRTGSVNTLSFSGQRLSGYNTDADGFKRAIDRDLEFNPEGKTVLVLGAGGTGRVIVYALLDMLAAKVILWNRTPKKLDEVVQTGEGDADRIIPIHSGIEVTQAMKEADLVVNATSVGLHEKDGLPVDNLNFKPNQIAFDVIYHRQTAFLSQAKKAGAKTADGLGMLVYQGARSFEIWTGSPAPIELMRHTLFQLTQGV